MKLPFVVLLASFLSTPLFANTKTFHFSAGIGDQYGGILGARMSYKDSQSEFYGSLGLVGLAVGFESTFDASDKHTYGLVLGAEVLRAEDGYLFVTYNYHFDSFANDGFVIGAGVGITREDESGLFGNSGDIESSAAVTLNLGYKF